LRRLIEDHAEKLDTTLRRTCVQSLIMLQNRGMQPRDELLKLLFKLFGTPDKALRALLFSHIVNDIRHLNRSKSGGKNKAQSIKVNQTLQNFMFEMLKNDNVIAAKKSLVGGQHMMTWMGLNAVACTN
jgi:protein SDA1